MVVNRLGADAQLKVTTSELKSKSSTVQKLSADMKNQYNALRDIMNSTAGYWQGSGGDRHRTNFKKEQANIDDMFRRINEHVVDLMTMAGVYEETEEKIKSDIQDTLPSDVII